MNKNTETGAPSAPDDREIDMSKIPEEYRSVLKEFHEQVLAKARAEAERVLAQQPQGPSLGSTVAAARNEIQSQQHMASDLSFNDKQAAIRGNYNFFRLIRVELEAARAIIRLEDSVSEELSMLNNTTEYMRRLLDLRIASIRAAMLYNGPNSYMKAEIAENYYQILAAKAQKTDGKWANGEKSFGEVHQDVLDQAVRNLPKQQPQQQRGHGDGSGDYPHKRGRFGGRGGGRMGGRGGRGEGAGGAGGAAGNE